MIAAALLFTAAFAQERTHALPAPDDSPPAAPRATCGRSPDEITVCAEDPARFRAGRLEDRYRPSPIRARVALPGGGSGEAEAVQRGVAPGISVPSLMFNLHVPLGKPSKPKPDK